MRSLISPILLERRHLLSCVPTLFPVSSLPIRERHGANTRAHRTAQSESKKARKLSENSRILAFVSRNPSVHTLPHQGMILSRRLGTPSKALFQSAIISEIFRDKEALQPHYLRTKIPIRYHTYPGIAWVRHQGSPSRTATS